MHGEAGQAFGRQPGFERRCSSLGLVGLHQDERQPEGRQRFAVTGHSHSVARPCAVSLQRHAVLPEGRKALRPLPRQRHVGMWGKPRRVPAGHGPAADDEQSLSHHVPGASSAPVANSCQTASFQVSKAQR